MDGSGGANSPSAASSTSLLSQRQREQLNNAIHPYLVRNSLNQTAEQFITEANISNTSPSNDDQALEKKWIGVLRLQKKILDLQSQLAEAQHTMSIDRPSTSAASYRVAPTFSDNPRSILRGHRNNINALKFHPTIPTLLVSASDDTTIKVWDLDAGGSGGRLEGSLRGHTLAVHDISFSGGTTPLLASASSDLTIKIWTVPATTESGSSATKTLHGHEHTVSGVRWLPGDSGLVSCSRDKTVRIWDWPSGYCVRKIVAGEEWVRRVEVAPASPLAMIATACADRTVRIWKIGSTSGRIAGGGKGGSAEEDEGIVLRGGHDHVVECVCFVPREAERWIEGNVQIGGSTSDDGKNAGPRYLLSGGRDKRIVLWEIAAMRIVSVFEGHDNWVRSIVFPPAAVTADGAKEKGEWAKWFVSVGDDKSLRVWDLESKRCVRVVENIHEHFVACAEWNGRWGGERGCFATAGVDQIVKVWGVK
eukprot:TRINITY_DN550_c0_g2_i2.p1 TRINITY_DN550_c0_g2~~TRINITY_DN550_c0_g2_i2.p1  ORF type:complete len:492 (+),score=107.20 TRINITY_DN550_c0_g2_i2:47-1477(+)